MSIRKKTAWCAKSQNKVALLHERHCAAVFTSTYELDLLYSDGSNWPLNLIYCNTNLKKCFLKKYKVARNTLQSRVAVDSSFFFFLSACLWTYWGCSVLCYHLGSPISLLFTVYSCFFVHSSDLFGKNCYNLKKYPACLQ